MRRRGSVQRGADQRALVCVIRFGRRMKAKRSVTDRPQPSGRHTSTTSISRRPAAGCLQQFLTSFSLCRAGANLANLHGDYPATAVAYSRMARFCIGRVCWLLVDTRAYRPARNIFGCLRDWQKTSVDFAFWEARLGAT